MGRPLGSKGEGTKEFVELLFMIKNYNQLRHSKTVFQLRKKRDEIFEYYYKNRVELAAPIGMHLV